jgi:ligand-binding sensor domain-containing protein
MNTSLRSFPIIPDTSIILSVCAIMFCIGTFSINARTPQGLTFERITTDMIRFEKGLSQNTVQCMMQDRIGFMWFGTWDGLNKYDGYTFSVWNEESGLSNQNIQAIVEDHEGLIWIGTEDGLNVYNRTTDQITIYRTDHRTTNSLVHNRIRTLSVAQNGDIWIGTNRGISVFRKKTGMFENYRHDIHDSRSLINNWINHIFCARDGQIWISTFKGLELFDPKNKTFIHFNRSTGWDDIAMLPTYVVAQSHDSGLWISNQQGMFFISPKTKVSSRIDLTSIVPDKREETTIYNLMFDYTGLLWIGTDRDGLIRYDPVTASGIVLRSQKDYAQSLSNDQIYSLYTDEAGIVWVGTYSGLNKYDRNSSKFRHHRQQPTNPQSLLSDVIFGFFEDSDGMIWVGTDKGISLFNPEQQTFSLLKGANGKPTPLIQGVVRTFFRDSGGIMWIGSMGGLTRLDPWTNSTQHYRSAGSPGNSLVSNYVWRILQDRAGHLWIATERGLSRFDKRNGNFTNYLHEENNPGSLPDNNLFDLYLDRNGRLWIASGSGLCWYDAREDRFVQAINNQDKKLTANQRRTASIYEAPDGTFWVGTMGGGLMRLDVRTGKYRFYTEKDGLPNNVVYRVMDDQTGNLWIPTNRGLARFNIVNESFIIYTVKDGIQSNEFNLGAGLRTRNGRILFGGMNGFNSFFPEEIRKNLKPARIAISGFYVFDKLIRRELFDGDTIRLRFSENFFAFTVTALDFANPAKNQYRYFLQNFEKGWVSADAYNRSAQYTNVPPGRYSFRVKGSNNDGIWNDEGIAITVIISPPWYTTWGFRGGAAGASILLVYIMVMTRIRQINRKHAIEKQILEMERQYFDLEQKALRLQMNPHFIFNTLNSIQSYMISNEAETAIEYLAKFARLMRQVLANSRESFIPVKEELAALQYYLEIEQLRFEDKFEFEFILDPAIDEEFTGIPPMILQPYIENAIIHGLMYKSTKGKVTLRIEQRPDYLFCVIEDDGVGREKALQMARDSGLNRKSSGMMITQQRLDILNQNQPEKLKVVVIDKKHPDGRSSGTRIEIHMPVAEI